VWLTLTRSNEYIVTRTGSVRKGRVTSAVWDITKPKPQFEYTTADGGMAPYGDNFANAALLLFCLSALPAPAHLDAVKRVSSLIAPGGSLLFRDYGLYDDAQLNLVKTAVEQKGRVLDDNTYVKSDGTICHYFSTEEVKAVFEEAGFEVVELEYVRRQYANREDKTKRRRCWIHGKFTKKETAPVVASAPVVSVAQEVVVGEVVREEKGVVVGEKKEEKQEEKKKGGCVVA